MTTQDSTTEWQHELQLQALRQVIDSNRAASLNLESRTFKYASLLSALVAVSIAIEDLKGAGPKTLLSAASLSLGGLAVSTVLQSAAHKRDLHVAMLLLEEKLGMYAENGIGLPGTALPEHWNRPNHISVRYGGLHALLLIILMTIAAIVPWL